MIWVEPGTFTKMLRQVTINTGFYLGKYEVTQAQYEIHGVMNSNPSHFSGEPNRPVEQVSYWMK